MRLSLAVGILGLVAASSGCRYKLMPTPVVVGEGVADPFSGIGPDDRHKSVEVFFATDREPVDPADPAGGFTYERSPTLRLGAATVVIGDKLSWAQLRAVSVDPDRTRASGADVELTSIRDLGAMGPDDDDDPFIAAIEETLARSGSRDVYVYVHGVANDFERPLLLAAELSYYMGRDGAFVAYCWPSRGAPGGYAYDRESVMYSTGHFRRFLGRLAAETSCDRIHIVSHSAGCSLVCWTLREMRLVNADDRIGQVVLAAPDIDVWVFRSHFVEGIQDLPDQLTVYTNKRDEILESAAEPVYGRPRLGSVSPDDFTDTDAAAIASIPNLGMIEVEKAKGFDPTGHLYLTGSPWVSSDLVILLKTGWSPTQRGLVHDADSYVWRFPKDYPAVVAKLQLSP